MPKRDVNKFRAHPRLPLVRGVGIFTCALGLLTTSHIEAENADLILQKAASLVGNPYEIGGSTPGGFDCSGLVTYLYRPSLPHLPRLSRDMVNFGKEVKPGQWRFCDLLFYATGTDPRRINHVAIWYGSDTLIHSVSDGPETGVIITRASSKYWRNRYMSARRVLPEEDNPNPFFEHSSAPGEIAAPPKNQVPISPWDDFDGILRGDFKDWLENEKDDFAAYREENG